RRRRLVDLLDDAQLAHGGLAGRRTAAQRRFALHAPRPAEDLDFALVLVVLRFAVDRPVLGAFDLEEHVAGARRFRRAVRSGWCHGSRPSALTLPSAPSGRT